MPERVLSNQNSVNENSASKTSRYRPEIDGLRAFAVVAVIINHFNKDILPGGYLGVDIFFVISGYVITSSLFGRPSKDFKDFISGFYERRIKRLVPALSVFVLITSIAICLFNPAPDLSLWTGITSLFGLSNLYLLKQSTDYFAQSTELNVFTHTWSLGVEEQFYILFPFLIWFSGFGRQTKNGARNLFLAVGSLTIASLVGFLYLYPTNQPAAYFLMPSRFWEMAAGCLIFIGFQKRASVEQLLEKVPPLLVMALIVGVMYLPMSMASASTVAVVALSSILIASLKKQTAAFKVFTNPKVVYIGLISYSLYLWHWGVLSISRWTIGIHWWSVPFQVALMLGLAVASYRWIETPLRKGNWFGKRWKTLVVGGGVLVTLSGGLVALGKPLKGKLYVGEQVNSEAQLNGCSALSSTIIVVGDSHAGEISKAVNIATQNNCANEFEKEFTGNSFLFSHKVTGTKDGKISREVRLHSPYKFIIQAKKYRHKTIVANPYWVGFFSPEDYALDSYDWIVRHHYLEDGTNVSWQTAYSKYIDNIAKVASSLLDTKLILVAPEPEFNWVNQGGLPDGTSCKPQWFQLELPSNSKDICRRYKMPETNERSWVEMRRHHIMKQLLNLDMKLKNVVIFDPLPYLCNKDSCSTHDEKGLRQFRDDDHLSSYGASKLAPGLAKLINNN